MADPETGPSPPTLPAARDAPAGVVEAARGLALTAAARAGVTVDEAHEIGELVEMNRVIDAVWHREGDAVTTDMLRALAHSGNCILVARSGAETLGASVSFRGVHEGRPALHSHITGVLPGAQSRGVGLALKLRQRAWALANQIESVTWTFDPLVARNAHFNLTKLGAVAAEYLVDFYGLLHDDVNGDDATDRLLAVWRLTSPRASRALSGQLPVPPVEVLRSEGVPVVLDIGADGHPLLASVGAAPQPAFTRPERALARIPDDILAVRSSDRRRADAWRSALREVMTGLFASGLRPAGGSAPGWYVFGSPDPEGPG
jgi:predicted GNAT superfamily acetyltransferase